MSDLFSYWQDYPPTHVLVSAYLAGGKKSPSLTSRKTAAKNNFNELTQAVTAAGGMVNNILPKLYRM